jgi:hypothetical protein
MLVSPLRLGILFFIFFLLQVYFFYLHSHAIHTLLLLSCCHMRRMLFLNAPSLNVIFLLLLPYAASIQASASTLSFARITPELFPFSFFVLVIFFLFQA